MKMLLAGALLAATFSASALAAEKTVTLSVPGITCAACPITVRKALERIDGVRKAEVSYQRKEAVVSFDDATTSPQALANATANAGYPSSIKK